MHELSLAHSILEIVDEYADKHSFKRVNSLRLSLGRLSCVETSTLKFAFDQQAIDTCAQGAELNFEILPFLSTNEEDAHNNFVELSKVVGRMYIKHFRNYD